MKVALIHEWLTTVAGSERVLLAMKELFPEAPIYTSVFDAEKCPAFKDFKIHTSFLQKAPLAKRRREVLVPFTPLAFEQFDLSKYDVVISSSHMAAKGVLTKPDTMHISYCHTPPRYLWEPDVDPRAKGGKLKWLKNRTAHSLRIWDRVAADRVDYFIANSNYIANRIKKYYQRESTIIYPPVDVDRFSPAEPEEAGDYFLFASRLVGYKQCDLVVDAFNDLGLPLKIIGQGPEKERLQKKAKENIEFLGYLSDEKIGECYSKAKAFIFPAEEDFGIVAVEAMAAGRPVIAYKTGGQAESVVKGETGVLFDEQMAPCLIDAVRNFKPEEFDPNKIRKHAEKFSKERFLKELKAEIEGKLKGFNRQ